MAAHEVGSVTSASQLGTFARFGLLIGPMLSMIDSSVVNVAVPDIAREFQATLDHVQWVVSGYLLALGVGLAATSYLAKRFGTLRVYLISMLVFVLASAACAAAPSLGTLIGFGLTDAPPHSALSIDRPAESRASFTTFTAL